ncbi:hypothetical protein C0Q70_12777 [Pomacea canaliculata]|uniref:Uncharacterized protein n=1 Tax=Pomacea canaliculata TaxID=400727 RepID=A0A2T7P2J8_POMCA|nr:hypothetical protein C0Q70_12777 [Pomacea canaliculata]
MHVHNKLDGVVENSYDEHANSPPVRPAHLAARSGPAAGYTALPPGVPRLFSQAHSPAAPSQLLPLYGLGPGCSNLDYAFQPVGKAPPTHHRVSSALGFRQESRSRSSSALRPLDYGLNFFFTSG